MKKTLLILAAAAAMLLTDLSAYAQNEVEVTAADSIATYVRTPQIDSSLAGVNILSLINRPGKGSAKVNQPAAVSRALSSQITSNATRRISGYRVRIFFDNSQNARAQSQAVAESFAASFPGIRVYRSHVSPYFKVTVGDFRTRSDAQMFANRLAGRYSSVFLVKETINYPDVR